MTALDAARTAALIRLDRAMKRGTGCYLTPEMVAALSVTFIGETASQIASERKP